MFCSIPQPGNINWMPTITAGRSFVVSWHHLLPPEEEASVIYDTSGDIGIQVEVRSCVKISGYNYNSPLSDFLCAITPVKSFG